LSGTLSFIHAHGYAPKKIDSVTQQYTATPSSFLMGDWVWLALLLVTVFDDLLLKA
jgi:hypothetical protein